MTQTSSILIGIVRIRTCGVRIIIAEKKNGY
jgi:hypothetical protein